MNLTILLPTRVMLTEKIVRLTAEAENGAFGVLPRHIDFVTNLVPGILTFETEAGQEVVLAVDGGVMVKQGSQVWLSTRNAVRSDDLDSLQQTIVEDYENVDDQERKARSALAGLEASFIQHFLKIDEGRP